ncbi:uncharacterized protein LOC111705274 [Eurytemora carolleeae]|uniref:uncharacterized protein LOC111705274 n=1 Tax=Eurytemora carolleeae TaxID=1294199 RepID=UPI000C7566E0|nr:uncharacterized protein LOC111705274 [Eurytemora carolleeae]|eukprot:XP_023333549.1 uncharacterized protein LOC111705274 [Eurytemora affinis]
MKIVQVFLLFLVARLGESATFCEFTLNTLVMNLSGDSSLDIQAAALIENVCTQLTNEEDVKSCERSSRSYWPYLAPYIYEGFISGQAEDICAVEHDCQSMSCEECLLRMNDVSTELNSEESIIEIINLVQGELYCNMENAWWDIENCQSEVSWFIPRALPVIGSIITEDVQSREFCSATVGGIC